MSDSPALPVLAYHQVNNLGADVSEAEFYAQMESLAQRGVETVFLADWLAGHVSLDRPTVAITFDDGYADQWLYAYPILKKFGIRATFFVCTERPLEGVPVRPNLDDVWAGRCRRSDLPPDVTMWDAHRACVRQTGGFPQFANWSELRAMAASGLVQIHSHGCNHAAVFVADHILEFYHNQDECCDLGWATDGDTRPGIPVYPRKSTLCARRYYDDRLLRDHLAAYAGGAAFFSQRSPRECSAELYAEAHRFRRNNQTSGHLENPAESLQRIETELVVSKVTVEEHIGQRCTIICWPWGHYTALSVECARRAGYAGAATYTAGVNVAPTNSAWAIRRVPSPRTVSDFQCAIECFSTARRGRWSALRRRAERLWGRVALRAQQGQLFATLRRKCLPP